MKPHESEALARQIDEGENGASHSVSPSTHASRADSSALDDPALADLLELLTDHLASPAEAIESMLRDHPAGDRLRRLLPALQMLAGLRSSTGTTILSDQSPALPSLLGDYRLIREIGRGGMGIVYEAEQISLRRRVALKILPLAGLLDDRLLKRFQIEAQAAAGLAHENIVPIYAVGCDQGIHYYAMQLIDGVSLAEVIAAFGVQEDSLGNAIRGVPPVGEADCEPLSGDLKWQIENLISGPSRCRRVAELGIQAAQALQHAHEAGIIHRDIKPANLLLDKDGKLWITDFGLARIEGDANLTMTGDFLGTLRYMSPEQALGSETGIDHRTDIYSLGATLYELQTGHPVVAGQAREQILRQLAEHDPWLLRHSDRQIPAGLKAILLKTIAKDPADRYATTAEVAADLQRWIDGAPITARRPGLLRRGWHRARKHSLPLVTAMLLVALSATATLLLQSPPETEAATGNKLSTKLSVQSTPLPPAAASNSISKIQNPESLPAPIPPPPGLIAWWSGDGHAQDHVGGHHGELMNGIAFAAGVVGQAFKLDGIDDHIRIPHRTDLNPSAGFTIESWVSSNCQGYRNIVSKWNMVTQDWSYCLQDISFPSHRFHFLLSKGGHRDLADFSGTTLIVPRSWYHVSATFDGNQAKIYVNGSLDAVHILNAEQRIHSSEAEVLIGATEEPGHRWFFSGLIDELSLYDRALDASEIAAIHQAGAAGKIKLTRSPRKKDRPALTVE